MIYTKEQLTEMIVPMLQSMPKGDEPRLAGNLADLVIEDRAEHRITGDTSDGYHTFNELYEFRLLYNAAFFNELTRQAKIMGADRWYTNVHKSWKHSDGEKCFGGGWFIVVAYLGPDKTMQISNHYEADAWDLFKCEAREVADAWDGHDPADVMQRLRAWAVRDE